MMRLLRGVILVVLTPFLLCLGIYGCVAVHVAALTPAHGATLTCPPSVQAAAARADLAALPVNACLLRAPTGDFVCSRKTGCNRCDIEGRPCPPTSR